MTIHKEGKETLLYSFFILAVINIAVFTFGGSLAWIFLIISIFFYLFLISFFRKPKRTIPVVDKNVLMAPADGKVVIIEEVFEEEYLKQKCKLVSIFMSPLNVHINWYPCDGKIIYEKYHPGKYLVAWNPKSSTENERTTVVLQTGDHKILLRQVAGAVARRIVCYAEQDVEVTRGQEMGFIKFGSRVDIYLPVGSKIDVVLDQVVEGCLTRIATMP